MGGDRGQSHARDRPQAEGTSADRHVTEPGAKGSRRGRVERAIGKALTRAAVVAAKTKSRTTAPGGQRIRARQTPSNEVVLHARSQEDLYFDMARRQPYLPRPVWSTLRWNRIPARPPRIAPIRVAATAATAAMSLRW